MYSGSSLSSLAHSCTTEQLVKLYHPASPPGSLTISNVADEVFAASSVGISAQRETRSTSEESLSPFADEEGRSRRQEASERGAEIYPRYSDQAEFKDRVHFVKFDVDEVPAVTQALGVRAMPTFFFFKDGKRVDEVVGANPPALLAALQKLAA
ncbi:hypothetical protein DCS_00250 [Drechmeria coniospora]|uniref:Thioredoxin domain-containing protein n=1 Tax=Drechmeria coniospora TaxID=98403 RepID=A0A151GPV8_DRECN|nr:hypothetical protein DCS_00250 [Drechmeria coniospora]KYK59120.1 hypothetical protein DCS_00250 [Drechmeria coniospora]